MGIEPFEVIFFFGEKFTKFNLALKPVIKNRSKVFSRLFAVFITIWTKNFFYVKTPIGIPLDSIFLHTTFFSVKAPGPGRYLNENLLRYDWRSSYMIWSQWKKLIFVKSLMGTKLGSFFFKDIFFSVRSNHIMRSFIVPKNFLIWPAKYAQDCNWYFFLCVKKIESSGVPIWLLTHKKCFGHIV